MYIGGQSFKTQKIDVINDALMLSSFKYIGTISTAYRTHCITSNGECSVILLTLLSIVRHVRQFLQVKKTLTIWQISVMKWYCVCIAPWNWAQPGKKLIVTFMVHAMCIQCRVWTLPWSLMHSVATPKRLGQRLCRGRVFMSYWFKQ